MNNFIGKFFKRLMRGGQMRKGEILVIGSDSITINLHSTTHPEDISIHFKHKYDPVPCDHHHEDDLQWQCTLGADSNYYLTITWSVSGERGIAWQASW
jgi:hypothetical protein